MGTDQLKMQLKRHRENSTFGLATSEDKVLYPHKVVRHTAILPKGHGRLIDADKLAENILAARYEVSCEYAEGLHLAWQIINDEDTTPTIIPGDKEENNE